MYRVLSIPACDAPPKTAHYSPMLHNAIVAMALAFSGEIRFSNLKNRQFFVRKAESYLMDELARPNIAGVHALSMLGSYYASAGERNLGYFYAGVFN
jgi:3-dehydroquinate dehydratase